MIAPPEPAHFRPGDGIAWRGCIRIDATGTEHPSYANAMTAVHDTPDELALLRRPGHLLKQRHTWATNYNRSRTGSTFDLQVEGGWTTARMVDRYCKVRPLAERRLVPSPFTAPRAARVATART